MKKRSKLKKGLAILLSLAMVVGLVPGVGTMQVSAEESSATEETGTAAGITYTPLAGNPEGNYSEQWGDERYSMLLDGTADTKWCCSFTNPSYVIFKTSEPVYVNGYSIWTANDTGSESGRNPVAWTLSGCNDYDETNKTGGNWVTIHEVKGDNDEEALPAADKTEQSYSFAESEYSYQYFKLNITAIKDGSTMQLGDFSLTYNACEHQWVATGETIEPTCTEGGYEVYQCSLCQATKKEANSNPATGHRWEITETVAPTCTEEGYTHQECSACKEEQNIEIKSALGHELNENGVCTRCGISVPYLSCNSDGKNWTTSTCPSAFLVKADDTKWGTSDTESWYVASGTVTIDSRVTVNGTVHLILADNCNLTINGGIGVTQGNNFTIYAQSDGNEMGHLTIQNVSVKDAGIGGTSSISGKITINGGIVSSATQATTNSGAAIGGGRGYYGDVTINGGKVTASGYLGAGIGHGSQASGGSGGVVINGGKVTASSYIGAGIGGGYGGNAKVTIKGGVITATSSQRYGIGSGMSNPSSKVTITDSPVIFASSISDQSGKENNTWSGIIFEGNTGKVYGTSATVDEDCTIPGGKILEVAKEQTISIADNKTLTNEGIIYNNGTFTGAVTNSGTIHNTGTISGELGGTVYHYTVEPAENSNCQSVGLALKAADTAFEGTVTYALADSVTNVVIENESTLKVTNRDEIKDTIPVTATFTVNNVTMTKTGNISIPDHNFPAEFDDGFKLCSVCGKVIYQSAEVISDTHYPELIGNYAGYYAIENAGQLYWFAGLVNGDASVCTGDVTKNPSANAVLMKSITVNEGVLKSDGTLVDGVSGFTSWTPIGNYGVNCVSYAGTFDGQGFTISGLYCVAENTDVGFVGNSSGTIKNLGITNSYFKGKESVGAVCGKNVTGNIVNCFSASYIDATDNNAGGVCGTNQNSGTIINCYNMGSVTAISDAHSICGTNQNSSTITNCFFLDTKPSDGYATGKSEELFNSGEVAYLLSQGTDGEVWGQKLGENGDAYPVLKKAGDEGNTVYQYTSCKETTAYTNDSALSGITQDHAFSEQGICNNCNYVFAKSDLAAYISSLSEVAEANYSDATFAVYSNAKTEADSLLSSETDASAADLYQAYCGLKSAYEALKPVALTVGTVASPSNTGKQTGGGRYAVGETVTLTAEGVEGWTFNGWYESDKFISDKAEVTFTVTEGMSGTVTYTAKYTHVSHTMDAETHKCSVCGTDYYKVTFDYGNSTPTEVYTTGNVEFPAGDYIFKVGDDVIDTSDYMVSADTTITVESLAEAAKYAVTITGDAHCTLTVTDSNGNTVVNGDEVAAGTILKVSVKVDDGYKLTTTPASSYTVSEATTITAETQAKTYAVTVDNTYCQNSEAEEPTASVDDLSAVSYGTSLTLTAADANSGYEFLGWYQTNGKQLTAEKVYTVTITSALTVQPRYQQNSGTVTFMANDSVVGTFTGTSITEENLPETPAAPSGYEFDSWDKTVADINTMLADNQNVMVKATFKKISNSFMVSVYNGNAMEPENTAYEETTKIIVTAQDVADMNFAYWTLNGEIQSYNKTIAFYASSDCVLQAVYSDVVTTAKGTATLQTGNYDISTKRLSMVCYLTVPDGCTMVKAGVIAALGTSSKYNAQDELTMDNADYVKSGSNLSGLSSLTYTWIKGNVYVGDTWYARAYVTYTDSQNNTVTVYGDRITLNAGTDYDYTEKASAKINNVSWDASTKRATFVSYITVPDGAVMEKAGIVAANSSVYDPKTAILTTENAAYVKSGTNLSGLQTLTYTWIKGNVSSGDIWYARAYVIYKDEANVSHTVYGNIIKYQAE